MPEGTCKPAEKERLHHAMRKRNAAHENQRKAMHLARVAKKGQMPIRPPKKPRALRRVAHPTGTAPKRLQSAVPPKQDVQAGKNKDARLMDC